MAQKRLPIDSTVSSTYCSLKWDEIAVDFFNRNITACCQSPRHGFNIRDIKKDVTNLFNTEQLMADRTQLLENEMPNSCDYCWNEERAVGVSRRTKDSIPIDFYPKARSNFPKNLIVTLQSNLCNFTCIYCNHHYSSSWQSDILNNGPYLDLPDYTLSGKDLIKFKISINDYAKSELGQTVYDIINHVDFINVERFSIGGGEPLLVATLPKLLREIKEKNPKIEILISTGLGVSDTQFNNFIKETKDLSNIILSLSNETTGKFSEFIRYGSSWDQWESRSDILLNNNNYTVRTTSVVSILTVFDLVNFLKWCRTKGLSDENIGHNILYTPSFLDLRNYSKIQTDKYVNMILDSGYATVALEKSLISLTNNQEYNRQIHKQLIEFMTVFSQRRNLDLSIFPENILYELDN